MVSGKYVFYPIFPQYFRTFAGVYGPGENDTFSDALNQMDEIIPKTYFLHLDYIQMHQKSYEWNSSDYCQNSKNLKPQFMYIYRLIDYGTGHLRKLLKCPGGIYSHWMPTAGIWKLVRSECWNGVTCVITARTTTIKQQCTFWAFKSHLSSLPPSSNYYRFLTILQYYVFFS